MKKVDYPAILEELKEKMDLGKMSVMVGSGFSKNASHLFPDWKELLAPMVRELYVDEFDGVENDNSKIEEIVDRVGYLNIVSKYIDKKGYVEAICTYIEKHIPYIAENGNGKFSFISNGEDMPLLEEDLALHKMLVELPWNNIYTTNYDQLLEINVDKKKEEKISERIVKSAKRRIELENKLFEVDSEIKKQEQYFAAITNTKIKENTHLGTLTNDFGVRLVEEAEVHDIQKEISELKHKRKVYKELIIESKLEIRRDNRLLHECKTIISESHKLSLKKINNIIKLHGTLRSIDEKDKGVYGFDGDISTHYIISKEDYDSYPEKHEAFTQLMRISLLQESFCLIGFSGDDPNFKAWLSWVRNILKTRTDKEYKVYLIDVSDRIDIDEARKLFLMNHNIAYIPLRLESVVNVLSRDKGLKSSPSIKEAFQIFFKYLDNEEAVVNRLLDDEKRLSIQYKDKWREIEKSVSQKKSRFNQVSQLRSIKKIGFRPSIKEYHIYVQESILYRKEFFKKEGSRSTSQLAELMLYAIADTRLPIGYIWNQKEVDEIEMKLAQKSIPILKILKKYDSLLKQPFVALTSDFKKLGNDEDRWISVLQSAFTFNFKLLKQQLDDWKRPGKYFRHKASLLAYFDINQAIELLEANIKAESSIQERLASMQLLNGLMRIKSWGTGANISQEIEQIEQSGIVSYLKDFNYLSTQIDKKELIKPEPYGMGRNGVGTRFLFTNRKENSNSIQYLYSLIQLGFQQNIEGMSITSNDSWYAVHNQTFEIYPESSLFYSLQVSDDRIIKRIGQDYVYSHIVRDRLDVILLALMDSVSYAPTVMIPNVLCVCSELMIVVKPYKWDRTFFDLLTKWMKDGSAFSESHQNHYSNFIQKGLQFTTLKDDIWKVLEMTIEEPPNDIIFKYCYSIAVNKNFRFKTDDEEKKKVIQDKLDPYINSLVTSNSYNLYILYYLKELLSQEQILSINESLKITNLSKIRYVSSYSLILEFFTDDVGLVEMLKKKIIESPRLWDTGITSPRSLQSTEFISLEVFRLKKEDIIQWTKSEAILIYKKLKIEFKKLKNRVVMKDFNIMEAHFLNLLAEMSYFMHYENEKLNDQNDFQFMVNDIDSLWKERRGFDKISDGLFSESDNVISRALYELDRCLYFNPNEKRDYEITLILTKVLQEAGSPARIEQCLNYISKWLKTDRDRRHYHKLTYFFKDILKKFQDKESYEGYDVPYLFQKLIVVAKVLEEWEEESETTRFWMGKASPPEFNNLRMLL